MEKENRTNQKNGLSGWLSFLVLLLAVQGFLLWMDHRPMFFLDDSASYIWTALKGWIPSDRSFFYGYFIRLVAVSTQSLTALVILQVLLLCVVSAVMAHLLIRYFQVRHWIAFVIAFLASIEPLQLLYARYVMTESLALFFFAFYAWAVLHYLEHPQIKWFAFIQFLATLMIAVRFAFIPIVWICAVVIPLLSFDAMNGAFRVKGAKPVLRSIGHLAVSVSILFAFTTAYKVYHGYLQNKPPAYSYDSGFFALGYVTPIVGPDDFPDRNIGEKVLSGLRFSVKDRHTRLAHLWMEGGVVTRLQMIQPDRMKANAIARQAAIHAVLHKPLDFLKLGIQTFSDYLDSTLLRSSMERVLGNRRLSDRFYLLLKKRFEYSWGQSSALDSKTLTGRYFLVSGRWFQFLLFMPLWWCFPIFLAHDAAQRRKSLLMGLISFTCIGEAIFLAPGPVPRYLHSVAWLFFLAAGIGLNRIVDIFISRLFWHSRSSHQRARRRAQPT